MDEIWGPIIGTLGFTALIIVPLVVNKIIKYKLEIARINAQTTIKAEEIRAKNQLEIELLLRCEDPSRRSSFQSKETAEDNYLSGTEYGEGYDKIKRRV